MINAASSFFVGARPTDGRVFKYRFTGKNLIDTDGDTTNTDGNGFESD